MTKFLSAFLLFTGFIFVLCEGSSLQRNTSNEEIHKESLNDSSVVYETENLIVKRLSNHIYQHISFLETKDFGRVPCNGMLVVNQYEGIVFDTPTDNKGSLELIDFVRKELKTEIVAIIPTHFHPDCVGGLEQFEKHKIPAYATDQTIELLKKNEQDFSQSIKHFKDSLILNVGYIKVYAKYFGEGHTRDNVIGYVREDNAIFGGCLIKSVGASKGYLGDANTKQWPETVRKLKLEYPEAKIIIPGHGSSGGTELLDYTINLFE